MNQEGQWSRKSQEKSDLKYSFGKVTSSSCKCSLLLGLNFVEIENSFTKMYLFSKSQNFRIICYWKKTNESKPI